MDISQIKPMDIVTDVTFLDEVAGCFDTDIINDDSMYLCFPLIFHHKIEEINYLDMGNSELMDYLRNINTFGDDSFKERWMMVKLFTIDDENYINPEQYTPDDVFDNMCSPSKEIHDFIKIMGELSNHGEKISGKYKLFYAKWCVYKNQVEVGNIVANLFEFHKNMGVRILANKDSIHNMGRRSM